MSEWSKNVLGVFWKKGDKSKYLSGYIDIDGKKFPIVVYPNKFKEKENQPDFIIYKMFEKK
jgi:hypothetical protein